MAIKVIEWLEKFPYGKKKGLQYWNITTWVENGLNRRIHSVIAFKGYLAFPKGLAGPK